MRNINVFFGIHCCVRGSHSWFEGLRVATSNFSLTAFSKSPVLVVLSPPILLDDTIRDVYCQHCWEKVPSKHPIMMPFLVYYLKSFPISDFRFRFQHPFLFAPPSWHSILIAVIFTHPYYSLVSMKRHSNSFIFLDNNFTRRKISPPQKPRSLRITPN